MSRLRSALFASTNLVSAAMAISMAASITTVTPALAGVVASQPHFTVQEVFGSGCGNCGTYIVHNGSGPGIEAYEFDITNPHPLNADPNRSDWEAYTFGGDSDFETVGTVGSGSGSGTGEEEFDCSAVGTAFFGNGSSGFCYVDQGGSDPFNAIAPGETQVFSFNSLQAASDWKILYTDANGGVGVFSSVPEPGTLALFGGVGVMGLMRKRRKDKSKA